MKESLSPDIDAFLSVMAVEKGLARNTLEAYSRDLNRLAGFLRSKGVRSWRESDALRLRSYLAWLRGRGLAKSCQCESPAS